MAKLRSLEEFSAFRLTLARVVSVTSEVGPNLSRAGGSLSVEVEYGAGSGAKPKTIEASVKLDILGIPKGSKGKEDFAFKISLEMHGTYIWTRDVEMPDISSNEEVQGLLCQSIYVTAASEIRQLATRMGFGDIRVDWDIRSRDIPAPSTVAVHAGKPKKNLRAKASKANKS